MRISCVALLLQQVGSSLAGSLGERVEQAAAQGGSPGAGAVAIREQHLEEMDSLRQQLEQVRC